MFVTQSVAVASSLSNQGTSYISLDEVTGGRREERERRPSGASVKRVEGAEGRTAVVVIVVVVVVVVEEAEDIPCTVDICRADVARARPSLTN